MKIDLSSVELKNRKSLFDSLGYEPFEKQWYLHSLYDWFIILLAGGVRFSKSWWSCYEAAYRIYARYSSYGTRTDGKNVDRYWLVGKDYSQTEAEWIYLYNIFRKLKLLHKASTDFNGKSGKPSTMYIGPAAYKKEDCIVIETKSSDNTVKLASFAPIGIIICEAAQCEYEVFLKSVERLTQTRKHGSWMILAGTFETSLGWYVEMFNRWRGGNETEGSIAISCPSWENPVEFPGGRSDPAIVDAESKMTRERFQERFGGEPCPPQGAIMAGYFRMGIHVSEEKAYFDEKEPVYLGVDPGFVHAGSVLAVQFHKDELGDEVVRVIDEVYTKGIDVDDVITACEQKYWWANVDKYKSVIDQAGYQRRAEGHPVAEQWHSRTGISFRHNKVPREEGTDLLKRLVKVNPITNKPHVYIYPSCKGLISEWGGCVNPISNQPEIWQQKCDRHGNPTGIGDLHDDSSKALIYLLWDKLGYAERRKSYFRPRIISHIAGGNEWQYMSSDVLSAVG